MRSAPAPLAFSLLMLAALAACSSATTVTTATALSTQATATPTPELRQSATPSTASPTGTPVPTETPQLSTPTPTATSTPTATPTLIVEFVDNTDCSDVSRESLSTTTITVQQGDLGVSAIAEIAATAPEQSQGLMCRESVPEGTGMLFVFETDRSGGFWMFNTYIPLDIIYFGGQNGDVSIKQMAPCTRSTEEEDAAWRSRCAAESREYRSDIFYRNALELPQGWLEAQGFDLSQPSSITVSID